MARCSRSRILARSPHQSTPAPRPRWSASTAPMARVPEGQLIADANGDLFGTTEAGGANGDGAVFEIQNTGTVSAPVYASAPTTLVSFNGSNGIPCRADRRRQRQPVRHNSIWRRERQRHGVRDPEYWHGRCADLCQRSDTWSASTAPMGQVPTRGLIVDANGDLFGTTITGARTARALCSRSRILARSPRQSMPVPDHAGQLRRLQWRTALFGRLDRGRQRRPVRYDQ